MNIEEKAAKFILGNEFNSFPAKGSCEWIEKDAYECNRWYCDGDAVAVRRPEDGAIAFNHSSTYEPTKRRIEAIKKLTGIK